MLHKKPETHSTLGSMLAGKWLPCDLRLIGISYKVTRVVVFSSIAWATKVFI